MKSQILTMRTARPCRSDRVSTTSKTFLSQSAPFWLGSLLHERLTLFRNFSAYAFLGRTRLLFIIPPFILLHYFSLFCHRKHSWGFSRFYTTLHYHFDIEPPSYDHTNYTFHIHTHYTCFKVLRGRYGFKRQLASTGRDRNRWTGAYGRNGEGVSWLIQKAVMGWALL